jgi:hypothetical protein
LNAIVRSKQRAETQGTIIELLDDADHVASDPHLTVDAGGPQGQTGTQRIGTQEKLSSLPAGKRFIRLRPLITLERKPVLRGPSEVRGQLPESDKVLGGNGTHSNPVRERMARREGVIRMPEMMDRETRPKKISATYARGRATATSTTRLKLNFWMNCCFLLMIFS